MRDRQRTSQAHENAMLGSQKAAQSFVTPVILNNIFRFLKGRHIRGIYNVIDVRVTRKPSHPDNHTLASNLSNKRKHFQKRTLQQNPQTAQGFPLISKKEQSRTVQKTCTVRSRSFVYVPLCNRN